MTVSDLQKHFRALAEIIGAAKGAGKELSDAANALAPFGHHSVADFAKFLQLAAATYTDGRLPTKPAPAAKAPKPEKVTPEQLASAIQGIRNRLARQESLTRDGVRAELAKYESLTKPQLTKAVKELGYKSAIGSKSEAIDRIVERLTAGVIADARSQV